MKQEKLKFLPFSSMIDSTFWYSLSRLKLEHLRLDDAPLPIYATFHAELNSALPALASLNYETFQQLQQQHLPSDIQQRPQNSTEHLLHGHLKLFNALPEFNGSDKRQLIADAGQTIWESIIDEGKQSEVDADLELHLSRFLMIAFADLKRYSYHYWCAFPALNFPTSCFEILESSGGETLRDHFTSDQVASLLQQYGQLPSTDKLFFAVIVTTTLEGDQKTEKVKVEGYKSFWSSAINSLNGDNSKVKSKIADDKSNKHSSFIYFFRYTLPSLIQVQMHSTLAGQHATTSPTCTSVWHNYRVNQTPILQTLSNPCSPHIFTCYRFVFHRTPFLNFLINKQINFPQL